MKNIYITRHAKKRYKERINESGNVQESISEDVLSCVGMFSGDCVVLLNKIKFIFVNYNLVTVIERYSYVQQIKEKSPKKRVKRKN